MKKFLKQALALTLALCSLLVLCLPYSAPQVCAAEYGETTDIGVVLKGKPNISGSAEIAEKDGRQYLGVPIKGGEFVVFALTDFLEGKPNANGNYIYAQADSGIGVPRGVALDSKGNFYVTGDSSSVFWYNIHTGKSGKISTGASAAYAVAVDEQDNVYVAAKSGGGAVYQLDMGTKTAKKIYSSADFTYANGVAAGDGKVYFQGPRTTGAGGGAQIRMLSADGALQASYDMPGSGGSYYLSYVDGVVFCGTSASSTDGLVALDTAGNKLTKIDIGMNTPMLGVATKERNGKSYIVVSGLGIYEYDVATRQLGRKVSSAGSRAMRAVNGYVKNGEDVLLLSVGPSSVTTTGCVSSKTVNLSGLLEGAYTTYLAQSMAPGVPGTGVAVYVGAYLSSSVASYSPNGENPINSSAFSNGHDQTDSMIVYNGKLYAGCYSGAYLVEYDPKTGQVRDLVPGLKEDYSQLRIHGLAAGDNKIFFSTIPKDQTLGGAIGWYDLSNDTWYCQRNVVKDQSVMTLAYDEQRDILYGGTTIRGGTNSTPTADQAVLMAYDVNAKKVLATTTVSDLTGDKPRNISGIARDPNTGKFWGLVSHTVFSFAYNNGKLTATKEWAAGTTPSNPYPDSAGKSWHARPIVFDRYGNMYIGLNEAQYGIMRFTMGNDGGISSANSAVNSTTRIYTLGADGNLYYYTDRLYKLTLAGGSEELPELPPDEWETSDTTPDDESNMGVDIDILFVQVQIDGIGTVTADSGPTIQGARESYDALTPEQQAKVGNAQTLFDAEKAFEAFMSPDEGQASDTDTAIIFVQKQINAIGVVTNGSGSAIRYARERYDALTPEQQAKVNNAQTLFDAEKAYEALTAPAGGDDAARQPDNTMTVVVVIAVVALAVIAAAVITSLLLKKKKAAVGADAHIGPWNSDAAGTSAAEETPAVEEILDK